MPLTTVHLVALAPNASVPAFVRAINTAPNRPLLISRAIRWIIHPEDASLKHLTDTKWDLLIVTPAELPLPSQYLGKDWVSAHWTITAGVPGSLLKSLPEKNKRLLYPQQGDVPPLTGSLKKPKMSNSSQGLELDGKLLEWSKTFELGNGAVSMFNLLAFKPGKEAHDSYLRYGKAFAETIGSKRGGNAKIVGKVVPNQGTPGEETFHWDEIALAHYPSIHHFTDMLGSEDYQAVNQRDRQPALRDTCILCTSELHPDLGADKAKL